MITINVPQIGNVLVALEDITLETTEDTGNLMLFPPEQSTTTYKISSGQKFILNTGVRIFSTDGQVNLFIHPDDRAKTLGDKTSGQSTITIPAYLLNKFGIDDSTDPQARAEIEAFKKMSTARWTSLET